MFVGPLHDRKGALILCSRARAPEGAGQRVQTGQEVSLSLSTSMQMIRTNKRVSNSDKGKKNAIIPVEHLREQRVERVVTQHKI